MNLKQRFIIYLIPPLLGCVIALTIIWIQRANQQILAASHINNSEKSFLIQKGIINWFSAIQAMVKSAAADPDTRIALAGDSVATVDSSARYNAVLDNVQLRTMALVNADGIAIAAAPANKVGESYKDLSYINDALVSGNIIVTPPRKSRLDGVPLMTIAMPVEKAGVVFVSIPLSDFYKNLVRPNNEESGHDSLYMVFTSDCAVLAHENQDYVLQEGNRESPESELCNQVRDKDFFSYRGNKYTGSFSVVPETGWQVFVGTNSDSIKAELIRSAALPTIVGAFILALMIIVIVWLISHITGRINSLKDLVSRLSLGDVSGVQESIRHQQGLLNTADEISAIGAAVCTLADRMHERAELANRVSHGDLRVVVEPVSTTDMLGNALKNMSDGLIRLVILLKDLSSAVSATSLQLSGNNALIEQSSQQQNTSVIDLNARIDQLNAVVETNSNAAAAIVKTLQQTQASAEEGHAKLNLLIAAMSEIRNISKDLDGMMAVINGVSSQTSLIALNAAIEAARAGEHGRGFAVVADEVRKLSMHSSEATENSKKLVTNAINSIKKGEELLGDTYKIFDSILAYVQQDAKTAQHLSSQSRIGVDAAKNVSGLLLELEHLAGNNIDVVASTSLIVDELQQQVNKLQQSIELFKIQ